MREFCLLMSALAWANLAACATTEGSQRMAGLSPDAQKAVEEAGGTDPAGEKASLDASVQKYRTVTLTDEKTGKPKVICKRVRQPGTLSEEKICTTKEEWDAPRRKPRTRLTAFSIANGCVAALQAVEQRQTAPGPSSNSAAALINRLNFRAQVAMRRR